MGDIIRKICGADLNKKWRTHGKQAVVTPELREVAVSGFQRNQRVRVSEGPPPTPQRPSRWGAILFPDTCSLAGRSPEGGSGHGTWEALQIRHQRDLSGLPLLHRTRQERISPKKILKMCICIFTGWRLKPWGKWPTSCLPPSALLFCLLFLLPPQCSVLDCQNVCSEFWTVCFLDLMLSNQT